MTISASRTTDRRGLGTERLDLPVSGRVALLPRVDRETVSRSAETIARFLGTGRYLTIQTGIVIVWIALNIALPLMRWDPYPFILLNLAFSTQAAYAAPLILLAQNRQDDRDRASLTEDRAVAGRMRENTEFLTREVAALRLAQSEAATPPVRPGGAGRPAGGTARRSHQPAPGGRRDPASAAGHPSLGRIGPARPA
ncbi:DUF1003 domain-containing protein [Candidatus Frankia alpina]|uniref:DUF1003 domain-containing protein n=1 Tax=Candidatus Frankia alpina TaxID=2699483 RepID=UPI001F1926A2|nr:DUF1003 domain-containing protein [Candidatus Frankia alpina]